MLYTFICEYVTGGGMVAQVHAFDQEKAIKFIREYKIPPLGDEPEYFPFAKSNLREVSSFSLNEAVSDGIILIYEFL